MSNKTQKESNCKVKKCARASICTLKIKGTNPCLRGRCQLYTKERKNVGAG